MDNDSVPAHKTQDNGDKPVKLRRGTIKFVNKVRGYGFIVPDGGGADVFFHVSRYSGYTPFSQLQRGTPVLFDDELNGARVRAVIVRCMVESEPQNQGDSP